MPLNWQVLYPQLPRLAEAEAARLLRLAEQASAVAEELTGDWSAQSDAESVPQPSATEMQVALPWLGAAIRAWDAVVGFYPADSAEYQAGWQRRQRLQQTLVALLRRGASADRR